MIDFSVKNLLSLDISSACTTIPFLKDADIDYHLPDPTNFKYYSSSDFHDLKNHYNFNNKTFSVLHSNIRSLAKNHDKLIILLEELGHNFSLIGLSETKIKLGEDCLANIDLYGYRFLSQPSLSNAGGVGLFAKKDLNLVVRNVLSVSNCEFEALWVDIELSNQKIICAVVY